MTPRVFSYVVAHDTGFAPNPFHGFLTLACCKPRIRQQAQPGDMVVGLSSRCERIVFLMAVTEKVSFAEYWADARFRRKRPEWEARRLVSRVGDNIYEPRPDGQFRQLVSTHWDHERQAEHLALKRRDLSVDAVLVSEDFVYFGSAGPELPEDLDLLHVTRGHRCRFPPDQVAKARRFFQRIAVRGVQGAPSKWSAGDDSWSETCA